MRVETHKTAGFVDLLAVPIQQAQLLLSMWQVPRARVKALLEAGGEVPRQRRYAPGTHQVARFVAVNPLACGEAVQFRDFYARFISWLDEVDRGDWTRMRFSRALPIDYVSLPGRGNRKFIHRLCEPPAAPYANATAPPGLWSSIDVATHLPAAGDS